MAIDYSINLGGYALFGLNLPALRYVYDFADLQALVKPLLAVAVNPQSTHPVTGWASPDDTLDINLYEWLADSSYNQRPIHECILQGAHCWTLCYPALCMRVHAVYVPENFHFDQINEVKIDLEFY